LDERAPFAMGDVLLVESVEYPAGAGMVGRHAEVCW
jgi:hypothetical protein